MRITCYRSNQLASDLSTAIGGTTMLLAAGAEDSRSAIAYCGGAIGLGLAAVYGAMALEQGVALIAVFMYGDCEDTCPD